MAKKREYHRRHPFFIEREVKELYIVCCIDDYSIDKNVHQHGFFPAPGEYLRKGGCLWDSKESAIEAAKYVLSKNEPERQYGVFKMVAIVEDIPVATPTRVTNV